jgi:hypothetical protein
MTKRTFKAKLTADSGGLFFQVPFDVKTEFGKARAPVRVTLGRYTYASTVAVYGGKYYVPVRREHREAAHVTPGKTIGIRLELDEAKRDVKAPADLARALLERAGGNEGWQKLSYTHRREHVQAILAAKKPETRVRRVSKAVAPLRKKR